MARYRLIVTRLPTPFKFGAGGEIRTHGLLFTARAGWHTSAPPRARAPASALRAALLPDLQPAEHRWPLTNDVLVNRHFASIEDLEDAQLVHCAALQRTPNRIRSNTRFHWWPKQIHKCRGPRWN
jgi:hypothetical protein